MDRLTRWMLYGLVSLGVCAQTGVPAAAELEIPEAVICQSISERECVDPALSFPSRVGRLYCWTRVVGALGSHEITHVWYFQDKERARVALPVRSLAWRTYSSKQIQLHETGAWKVEILGPEGKVLKSVAFEITP